MKTESKKLLTELLTTSDLVDFRRALLSDIDKLLKERIKPTPKTWLKSSEAKALLQVSNGTLQNMRNNGSLPFTKIGGVIYYNREDIQKMLLENKQTY
ncbi:MAG: helix-turn-helix domain-containing protein [Carboxylicivirga sp.]|jgi:hypothetical protein|nr:helix-turn-helix domain-containing protein [Carboxylicivirga sp.]